MSIGIVVLICLFALLVGVVLVLFGCGCGWCSGVFVFWISCYCLAGCAVSDVWICVAILGLGSWRCCAGGWCYLLFVLGALLVAG